MTLSLLLLFSSSLAQDIPTKAPPASCRNGTPVVLITHQRTPVPAKLEISTKEVGEDHMYIVKVCVCVCCWCCLVVILHVVVG